MQNINISIRGFPDFKPYANLSNLLKIDNSYFISKDNSLLGLLTYGGSPVEDKHYYESGSMIPRNLDYSYNNYFLGDFDLNSIDADYIKEVNRIKSRFNFNKNAKFTAKKFNTYVTLYVNGSFEYRFFDIFVFDFDDIFLPSQSELYTYSTNYVKLSSNYDFYTYNAFKNYKNLGLEVSDRNYTSGSSKEIYTRDTYFYSGDMKGTPYIRDSNGTVLGVSIASWLLLKDSIYYFFRINKAPIITPTGDYVAFEWNVYEIPNLKKCCLAECFGITE